MKKETIITDPNAHSYGNWKVDKRYERLLYAFAIFRIQAMYVFVQRTTPLFSFPMQFLTKEYQIKSTFSTSCIISWAFPTCTLITYFFEILDFYTFFAALHFKVKWVKGIAYYMTSFVCKAISTWKRTQCGRFHF